MEGTLKITLRLEKVNRDGKAPLRLIYSLHGQRKVSSVGVSVYPFLWDDEKQKAEFLNKESAKDLFKDKKPEEINPLIYKIWQQTDYELFPLSNDVKKLNQSLSEIELTFEELEQSYKRKGVAFSSDDIMNAYKSLIKPATKKEAPNDFIFDFIDQYIKDNEPNRAKGSLQVYKSLKTHLRNYQTAKRTKVRFDKMDMAFMRSFQNFLIDWKEVNPNTKRVNSLNNVTIAKQLSSIKTVLTYAKREGIEIKGNYKDFSIKKQKLEVIALTEKEFQTLYKLDLTKNERLAKVRDLFCFSCMTGLRYSDLKQLKHDHIKTDEIQITVTKTKDQLIIPLNKYSLEILEKYKDSSKPLPIISNQRVNEYIKELCKIAKITDPIEIVRFKGAERITTLHPKHELISIHTGRKTFATLSLEKGMNAETVMKLGGWTDYKSFSRYVNITEEVKRKAMVTAWGAPRTLKVVNGGKD